MFLLAFANKVSLYKYSDPVNRLFVFYGNIFKNFTAGEKTSAE
jgi:hypothetical protein